QDAVPHELVVHRRRDEEGGNAETATDAGPGDQQGARRRRGGAGRADGVADAAALRTGADGQGDEGARRADEARRAGRRRPRERANRRGAEGGGRNARAAPAPPVEQPGDGRGDEVAEGADEAHLPGRAEDEGDRGGAEGVAGAEGPERVAG